MNIFLDSNYSKKIRILETILYSENSCITRKNLAHELSISQRTIVNIISEIKYDFIQFSIEKSISICYNPKNSMYTISLASNFSLQSLKLIYLEKSIRFRLLNYLLTDELLGIPHSSKKLFTTEFSLRQDIKFLQQFFSNKKINILTRKKIQLVGNELHIRFFYTLLYTISFQGKKWPFKFISITEVNTLVNILPSELYCKHSIEKRIRLYFYMAITILRIRKKKYIQSYSNHCPLYEPTNPKHHEECLQFKKSLKKFLPGISTSQLELECLYLLSGVLSLGSYSKIKYPPQFFLSKINKKLLHECENILEVLSIHFNESLPIETYQKILYCVLTTHYRLLFLGYPFLEIITEIDNSYSSLNIYKKSQKDLLTRSINKIFYSRKLSHLKPYKGYLIQQYIKILERYLPIETYSPCINILIFSEFSKNSIEIEIIKTLGPYFNMKISTNINHAFDIIISDILVHRPTLIDLKNNPKIIYVSSIPTNKELQNVAQSLHQIVKLKGKNSQRS